MPTTRSPVSIVLVFWTFFVVMVGGTLPTPLYAIYSRQLGLDPFGITIVFAAYAVGTFLALLLLGRMSDLVGRKPVLLLTVVISALSTAVFLTTPGVGGLLLGRLISGFSVGLVTGAATAHLAELHSDPARSARLAIAANAGGLGCGALIAGVIADRVSSPTVVPYVLHLFLLVPALFVLMAKETVKSRPSLRSVRPQRLRVPSGIRAPFAAAAIGGFTAFAVLGLLTGVSGNIITESFGSSSHQTVGVISFLAFACLIAAQLAASRLPNTRASIIGLSLMPLGVALITAAVPTKSMAVFVIGVIVSGSGAGFAFKSSLTAVTEMAPEDARSEVVSALFVASFAGLSVPIVAVGLLITHSTLLIASATLAALITVLVAVAIVIVRRRPLS